MLREVWLDTWYRWDEAAELYFSIHDDGDYFLERVGDRARSQRLPSVDEAALAFHQGRIEWRPYEDDGVCGEVAEAEV
jgi:hypothetical protein